MARVNLHVPDDFLEEIDRRAAALNVSRTSFIIMSLSQKFQQDDLMLRAPEMLSQIGALAADINDKTSKLGPPAV